MANITIDVGTITVIAHGNKAAGTYGPFTGNLTTAVAHVLIQLERSAWADFGATGQVIGEYSSDGGVTFRTIGGFKSSLGPASHNGVVQEPFISSDFAVPNVGQANRQLRATFILTGSARNTSLTFVVT